MVIGAIQSAIRSQNQTLRANPLQIMFVCMHLVSPPLRPHTLPGYSSIERIPALHSEDGDVI